MGYIRKKTGRIPIVPDDFKNKSEHIDKEILMDYVNNNLYILRDGEYINITGRIMDSIQQIQDGTSVIHICTEDTLPNIQDRRKNHWYLVVTDTTEYGNNDTSISKINYIYYGLIEETYINNGNYLLIAQNFNDNPDIVPMTIPEGYRACFYIPKHYSCTFKNSNTGQEIAFTKKDTIYCLNPDNSSRPYNVFISDESKLGKINIKLELIDNKSANIYLLPNNDTIQGLRITPSKISVEVNKPIDGLLDDVEIFWTDPRWVFKGWSSNNIAKVLINKSTWYATKNVNLYAYFERDDDVNKYTYKAIYKSGDTVLGEFYGVEFPNANITPKTFNGFRAPEKQKLTSNNQIITFNYAAIEYPITHLLDGGTLTTKKDKYTILDEYTPNTPTKQGYQFISWTPSNITKGTTGPITFTAKWKLNAVTKPGAQIRSAILALKESINEEVITIEKSDNVPSNISPVDISSNASPILMWYVQSMKTIKIYCDGEIYTNNDMVGVFKGFSKLRNVKIISEFHINPNTNISELFMDCTSLSNALDFEVWNKDISSDQVNKTNVFKNTIAENNGSIPTWYTP